MPRTSKPGYKRELARLRVDAYRNLRGRSPSYLRAYIGRAVIRILQAERRLLDIDIIESALSPSTVSVMKVMEALALEEYDDVVQQKET